MVQSCADNMTSENFGPASEILYQEVEIAKEKEFLLSLRWALAHLHGPCTPKTKLVNLPQQCETMRHSRNYENLASGPPRATDCDISFISFIFQQMKKDPKTNSDFRFPGNLEFTPFVTSFSHKPIT